MAQNIETKRDALGHQEGCIYYDESAAPSADPNGAYIDLFCDCHDMPLPEVGANGTDVIWPSGWTEPEARSGVTGAVSSGQEIQRQKCALGAEVKGGYAKTTQASRTMRPTVTAKAHHVP